MRWVIAKPAASSAALLIFEPVDKRSIAVSSSALDSAKARWAVNEDTLVLITKAITLPTLYSPLLVTRLEVRAAHHRSDFR